MTTAVKAVYEDGVFKPTELVTLPEKTEVEVLVPGEVQKNDDPTGWRTAREFIGMWKDAPRACPSREITTSTSTATNDRMIFVDTSFFLALALAAGERLYGEKMARIHWATPDEEKADYCLIKTLKPSCEKWPSLDRISWTPPARMDSIDAQSTRL
jgi:hypothetical protein